MCLKNHFILHQMSNFYFHEWHNHYSFQSDINIDTKVGSILKFAQKDMLFLPSDAHAGFQLERGWNLNTFRLKIRFSDMY